MVVNSILIDDPMPANYWPGYGYYLVDQGAIDGANKAPTISTELEQLKVEPDQILQIGDTLDPDTGIVTKFVSQLKVVQDADNKDVTVATAPDVKIAQPTDVIKQSTGGVR